MTPEQIEDLKEILVNISSNIEYITKMYINLNRKLEEEKVATLKIQNQMSITNHLIPETEKEINRIKCLIDNLESKKTYQGISIYNLYKISLILEVPIECFFIDR